MANEFTSSAKLNLRQRGMLYKSLLFLILLHVAPFVESQDYSFTLSKLKTDTIFIGNNSYINKLQVRYFVFQNDTIIKIQQEVSEMYADSSLNKNSLWNLSESYQYNFPTKNGRSITLEKDSRGFQSVKSLDGPINISVFETDSVTYENRFYRTSFELFDEEGQKEIEASFYAKLMPYKVYIHSTNGQVDYQFRPNGSLQYCYSMITLEKADSINLNWRDELPPSKLNAALLTGLLLHGKSYTFYKDGVLQQVEEFNLGLKSSE